MIRPHPEGDLSTNILVLGSEIIEMLNRVRTSTVVEEVMKVFLKRDPKRTPGVFLDALTLLFILGLIEFKGYRIRLNKQHDFAEATLF